MSISPRAQVYPKSGIQRDIFDFLSCAFLFFNVFAIECFNTLWYFRSKYRNLDNPHSPVTNDLCFDSLILRVIERPIQYVHSMEIAW